MAKRALLDVLERTIGKYVLNLDAESLNVAVWSGTIELNALELNTKAVNDELDRQAAEAPNLAIPFRVKSGRFQSFQVDVPWARLMSQPVVLRAKGLSIEAEAYDRTASTDFLNAVYENESVRAKKIQEHRATSIQAADDYRQQANSLRKLAAQDLEGTPSTSGDNATFGARLVRRIIENIQVEIRDVHLSIIEAEGSAGVILESFELVTTNALGQRMFVDRTSGLNATTETFLYKSLEIRGLGLYLDDDSSLRKYALAAIREDDSDADSRRSHSFIIVPLSFEAKLRQADCKTCTAFPKYRLDSEIKDLSLLLSKSQVEVAQTFAKQIQPSENVARPIFPEYRPLSRVTNETAKDWWHYAFRCIGRLNGRRLWLNFLEAFQKRNEYIPLYKRYAHSQECNWKSPLTDVEQQRLDQLEQDRSISVEGIMTWRNIADAQAEKEKEKHDASKQPTKKASLFTSLFGMPQAKEKEASRELSLPPVALSIEEMKELEAMTMGQIADAELSKDSKLAFIKFVLGSFTINLSTYGSRPLATLDMGMVATSLDANVDGSFVFKFSLTSLGISDRITPGTLFPYVLRNQDESVEGQTTEAFSVHIAKSKRGDQHLQLKLSTFEAVASPQLLLEAKNFLSSGPVSTYSKNPTKNALLAQSMSGSVDLFYDASEGSVPQQVTILHQRGNFSGGTQLDLADTLVEAWKAKVQSKATWDIFFDIHAPVIVIPEKCNDYRSNVLVFDLGQLRLKYGKLSPPQTVEKWFTEQKRTIPTETEVTFDYGSLVINNLTLVVGKASYWQRLVRKEQSSDTADLPLIEPVSMSIDFGIESTSADDIPRVCLYGTIPLIAFNASTFVATRVMTVARSWMKLSDEMRPKQSPDTVPDHRSTASSHEKAFDFMEEARRGSILLGSQRLSTGEVFRSFFLHMTLQKFSLSLSTDIGGIQSNLVSVTSSMTGFSDSSLKFDVSMGWFWILDDLKSDLPRMQRLIAHSRLPSSSFLYAIDGKYDIDSDLHKLRAFESDFLGSTELADVSLWICGKDSFGNVKPFPDGEILGCREPVDAVLDAKFTSLHVVWNPITMKAISAFFDRFLSFLDLDGSTGKEHVIILSPADLSPRADEDLSQSQQMVASNSRLFVKAVMEKFEVILNSAIDDLPLYSFAMSDADVSLHYERESNSMRLSLALRDISMSTPETGRTLSSYRTILGLAPGHDENLLSVSFYSGFKETKALDISGVETGDYETYAQLSLCPLRVVYIHAQVMSLVEYVTEGILGTLTARAASSAAAVAADIVVSEEGKKRFHVIANGLQLLVPEGPNRHAFFSISSGDFVIDYTAFPDPGGGHACLHFSGMSLNEGGGIEMLTKPVVMSADVQLPSESHGSKDEQAMQVSVVVSETLFVLTKSQYTLLLSTMEHNIGEADLFVRDQSFTQVGSEREQSCSAEKTMTHSGAALVDTQRRVYLDAKIQSLSLLLCGSSDEDPLIRLEAVEAELGLGLITDEARMRSSVKLKALSCTDSRLRSWGRQYRSLIYQLEREGDDALHAKDIFTISYESDGVSSSIDATVGSPCFVLIPDAIAESLSFFSQMERNAKSGPRASIKEKSKETAIASEYVQLTVSSASDAIEASVVNEDRKSTTRMKCNVVTSQCSVILVDLGGNALPSNFRQTYGVTAAVESIVLEGGFKCLIDSRADLRTGEVNTLSVEFHGTSIESYTAYGRTLLSPVQILEPSDLAFYANIQRNDSSSTDLRVAMLTPLDCSFSMKNLALVNAIVASMSECFDSSDSVVTDDALKPLKSMDVSHIEELESALEGENGDVSTHGESVDVASAFESIQAKEQGRNSTLDILSVKITVPEATFTIINDLQGVDDALIRVSFRNSMLGGQTRDGERIGDSLDTYMGFDLNAHVSVLADYFDMTNSIWKPLLLKPWELSVKIARGPSSRFHSNRPSTTIDVESFPCYMSFSEHFLTSLASANQMWQVYSTATSIRLPDKVEISKALKRSVAASAARTLVTSLPYAVENYSGIDMRFAILKISGGLDFQTCESGTIEYFRFDHPKGQGTGGKRSYGQDVTYDRSIRVYVGGDFLEFIRIETLMNQPPQVHEISGLVLLTSLRQEGKTKVLQISSGFDINNVTSIPISISLVQNSGLGVKQIGTCNNLSQDFSLTVRDGKVSKASNRFGVTADLLGDFHKEWKRDNKTSILLSITPHIDLVAADEASCSGLLEILVDREEINFSQNDTLTHHMDVVCRSKNEVSGNLDPFVVKASLVLNLVNGQHFQIGITFEPRATLCNLMPIPICIRTPMPHTYSHQSSCVNGKESIHTLQPSDIMEIYTPGPSIAVCAKTADSPISGTSTDWMNGWIDLPLVVEFRLLEPLRCEFPFVRGSNDLHSKSSGRGTEFFLVEGSSALSCLGYEPLPVGESNGVEVSPKTGEDDDWRSFFVTVCNFAIDHTGDLLFEQIDSSNSLRRSSTETETASHRHHSSLQISSPLGAFGTAHHNGRVTLLPISLVQIRLLHLTMDGDDGLRKSAPFRVEDISICQGGAQSTPIFWEGGTPSGFLAYRNLIKAYQSVIHIVPEYVVYNGSDHDMNVKQPGLASMLVKPGNIAPLRTHSQETATIAVIFSDWGISTSPMRVDSLGIRIAVLKAADGSPVGSVAIQTVIGSRDSRLVVKVGGLKLGAIDSQNDTHFLNSMLQNDFMRLRVQWSELRITLDEGRPIIGKSQAFFEAALDRIREAASPSSEERMKLAARASPTGSSYKTTWMEAREHVKTPEGKSGAVSGDPICTIWLHRFTIDWQRVFKDDVNPNPSMRNILVSPERSQLSVIIHNVQIRDETPNSPFPVVVDSTSDTSFFDLCIRCKGPIDSELVKVDLFDLNLAHANGVSQKIVVKTSEDFLWKLLDVANRILVAASELVGVQLELEWDDAHGGYAVSFKEKEKSFIDKESSYTPPHSDTLFDINRARVSPFAMLVSFKRNPQESRYKIIKGVHGAHLLNYFTRRLKFKIDKAELHFARYEARNIRGPADRLFELLSTVYLSRMKLKLVTIMTAASFQDWKNLAARDEGDDEYVEGDILRVTGNLAGNTVNYIFQNAGKGLGKGITNVTSSLGMGIENATDAIGVRGVGAGVNSLVSGVGEGVSNTVIGVGTGAGTALRGAGQGVGQVFGGVTGGALIIGKGIGKGITSGDGRHVVSGFTEGVTSVGTGVGQGVGTFVTGTAEGALSMGHGLAAGFKSIGKGLGGAFLECCSCFSCCTDEEEKDHENAITSPLLPNIV